MREQRNQTSGCARVIPFPTHENPPIVQQTDATSSGLWLLRGEGKSLRLLEGEAAAAAAAHMAHLASALPVESELRADWLETAAEWRLMARLHGVRAEA